MSKTFQQGTAPPARWRRRGLLRGGLQSHPKQNQYARQHQARYRSGQKITRAAMSVLHTIPRNLHDCRTLSLLLNRLKEEFRSLTLFRVALANQKFGLTPLRILDV